MNRRSFLGGAASATVPLLSGCVGSPLQPNRGRVVGKVVRVAADDGFVDVATLDETGRSSDSDHEFGDEGELVVPDAAFTRLQRRSDDVRLTVAIHHYGSNWLRKVEPGEAASYRTSRVIFNQLALGDSISFQTSPIRHRQLNSVSCVADSRENLRARCEFDEPSGSDSPPL
jgi:hypothetical protein